MNLDKLRIIAEGKHYCNGCDRFLEDSEVRYGMSGSYCTHHAHTDLNDWTTKHEYIRLASEILGEALTESESEPTM